MPAPDLGTATTVSFGTTSISFNIISVSGPSITRGVVDTTHLGTTNARTSVPTDLMSNEPLTLEVQHDGSIDLHTSFFTVKSETVTVQFGGVAGDAYTFSGYAIGYEPNAPLEDLQTATVTVQPTGLVTTSVT